MEITKPTIGDFKVKMMIYGSPGVGKTVLAATAEECPRLAPALYLNVEGGTLSILDKNLDTVEIGTFKDIEDVYMFLFKGDHKYKTVIVDSLTEVQSKNMDGIMAVNMSNPRGTTTRKDVDDIHLADWGKCTNMMKRLIRGFRDLPIHVIYVCLSKTQMDNMQQETVGPQLTNKVAETATGYVDIIGYLFTMKEEDKIVRKLLTQPSGKWLAKDRSGKLGSLVVEPTMSKIMDLVVGPIKGGKNGKKS